MKKQNLAAPFDRLPTTRTYARRLATMTGAPVVIVRSVPGSGAESLGLRFGVFALDELQPGDEAHIVERVEP